MYSTLKSAISWGIQKPIPMPSSQSDLCETCGRKKKYVENGFQHPFCSRSCARTRIPQAGSGPSCPIRGCKAPGKTAYGGFCSDAHANDAIRRKQAPGCAACNKQVATVGSLCSSCDRRDRAGPRLREIDAKDVTFQSIVSQFGDEWRGDGRPPVIDRIVEVSPPWSITSQFDAYRAQLDATSYLRDLRTYHASQCICDFGVKDMSFCNWKSCGICKILKSSFREHAFGEPYNRGSSVRYGDGIYSYLNPALADAHATSSATSPYRVMLACDVSTSSVDGADYVTDEERVFVGRVEAILPRYVILYRK
ncbi:hypothetical protein K474DRAFT_48002 [Panus rudis PR-1116 ss-1]|nr:hypothetical protein K474DRAFT_48002 [Panus rudis PR-1116 ss-1]